MADDLKPLIDEIKRGNALTTDLLKEKRADDTSKQILADALPEVFAEYDSARMVNVNIDEEAIKSDNVIRQEFDFLTDIQMKMFKVHTRYYSEMMNIAAQLLGPKGIMGLFREGQNRGENTLKSVAKGFVTGTAQYNAILEGKLEDIEKQRQEFDKKLKEESDGASASAKEEDEKDAAAAEKGMFKRLSESFTSGFKGLKDGFNNLTDSILGKAGVATAVLALGAFLVAKFPDLAEAVGDVTKAFVKLFKSGGRLFDPEDDYGFFDFFNENFYIFLAGFAYAFKNKIKALIVQLVIFSFNAIKKLFKKVILRGILTALVAGIGTAVGVSGGLVVGIAALIAGVVGAIIGAVMGLFDEFTREYKASGSVLKALGAGFLGILKGMLAGVLYVLEAIISFFTFGLLDFDLSSIIMDFDIGGAVRSLFSSISGYFENFSITDPSTWLGGNEPEGKFLGGPVASGTPYMVGEQGMELFVPGAAGSIIPNNMLGGGAPIIVTNNNISAPTNNSSHQHSNISITDNQQEIVGL